MTQDTIGGLAALYAMGVVFGAYYQSVENNADLGRTAFGGLFWPLTVLRALLRGARDWWRT